MSVLANRVVMITNGTGTGDLTLNTTPSGYASFDSRLAIEFVDGQVFYLIRDASNGQWEAGYGTILTSPTRLQRNVVLFGSNGDGVSVNFTGTGEKSVSATAASFMYMQHDRNDNTYAGRSAGAALKHPSTGRNLLIGRETGLALTTGNSNIALGFNALRAATTTNSQIAIGTNALRALTTGTDNVAIGHDTMPVATDALRNVALGFNALKSATSANSNLALGWRAMTALQGGQYNVAIGADAMLGSVGSSSNMAIGTGTLQDSINVYQNTAIGSFALNKCLGDDNTGIGFQALFNAASGAVRNTAIGSQALLAVTSGADNIALGRQAGNLLTTGSRNLIVGNGINVYAIGTNDAMNIRNLLYADFNMAAAALGSAISGAAFAINTTTGGFVVPRMTTAQRNAISTPANGVKVFNTDSGLEEIYSGGGWMSVFGNTISYKNKIVNPSMLIDQRNIGNAVTVNSGSTFRSIDQWFGVGTASAGVFTLQLSTTAPAGFRNSLVATVTTADASIASGDVYVIGQDIEGQLVKDFAFGTASASNIVLSFRVRSNITGTFSGAIGNGSTNNRWYPFTFSINAANTFETKQIPILGDVSGTWTDTNTAGLSVRFCLAAGATFTDVAGAWVSGTSKIGANGHVNFMATVSNQFFVTGVQLERGFVASDYEHRPLHVDLAICKRYYQKSYNQAQIPGAVDSGGAVRFRSHADLYWPVTFPVVMRAVPTMTVYSPRVSNATAFVYQIDGAGSPADRAAGLALIGDSGFTVNSNSFVAGALGEFHWVADASI